MINTLGSPTTSENISFRYAFLVLAWDQSEVSSIVDRVTRLAPGAEVRAIVIPELSEGIGQRHPAFIALTHVVCEHSRAARAAGVLPVVVLAEWPAGLASIGSGAHARELSPGLAILATPEVLWLFGEARVDPETRWPEHHKLEQIAKGLWDPTFDWTGLRQWLRATLLEDKIGLERPDCVVAIDDEQRYRDFEAYCAYRSGCLALAPASITELTERLNPDRSLNLLERLHTFEDIFVRFHDQSESDVDLSKPAGRSNVLSALGTAVTRTIVSSGDTIASDQTKAWKQLSAGNPDIIKIIPKPIKGLLDLWHASPIEKNAKRVMISSRFTSEVADHDNHAAHGALTTAALRMLLRAEDLLQAEGGFSDFILAATICVDVERLLRCRSPTTALEAVSLKHQAEVRLECVFQGVAPTPNIGTRLTEVASEVAAICSSYDPEGIDDAKNSAELEILNTLIGILRQYGRFEEEHEALLQAREVRRRIRGRQKSLRAKIEASVLIYPNFILASPFYSIIGFVFGVVACGVLFVLSDPNTNGLTALSRAVVTTLAIQPADADHPNVIVDTICMIWGLMHFGVLFSHIYSLISRR